MNIITHSSKINLLSESPLKNHIQDLFDQLSQETDIPPAIFLIGKQDLPTGPDFSFLGSAGMCSDLFETHQPGDPEFTSVFEWISYLPDLKVYEMLYLETDFGYLLIVPVELVEAHPDLKAVIDSQGLSDPQPLY